MGSACTGNSCPSLCAPGFPDTHCFVIAKHVSVSGALCGPQTDRVLAALALAVVVMDVDSALQVGGGPGGLVDGVHHEVQHELAVLEGVSLAPSHVLYNHIIGHWERQRKTSCATWRLM